MEPHTRRGRGNRPRPLKACSQSDRRSEKRRPGRLAALRAIPILSFDSCGQTLNKLSSLLHAAAQLAHRGRVFFKLLNGHGAHVGAFVVAGEGALVFSA